MMELLNDIEICCGRCSRTSTINKDEIDFYATSYDHGENGMGDEIETYCDGEVECSHCGYNMRLHISGFEYPIGCYNNEDSEIIGGDFVTPPHMGVLYYEEQFDDYFAYPEFDRIQNLIISIANDPDTIYNITPREFEELIERVLQDQGFETKLTPQTRDGGRDVIATKYEMGKPIVFYFECKHFGRKNTVGVSIVRALYGVQTSDRINKSFLVTTGHVTSDAKRFVEEQNTLMSIINAEEIKELIRRSAENY